MHPSFAIGLAVVVGLGAIPVFERGARWRQDDPAQVARGHRVYAEACASCHGAGLEGQAAWWRPGADGMLPAPPQDASGHTWQHSDAELTELVAHGVGAFTAADYRSGMPAFAGRLQAAEIEAVIAYIKSTWPAGQRAWQAAQTPGGPALADLPGDWVFPATCGYHLQPLLAGDRGG